MGNLSEETKIVLVDNNEQMRNNIKSQLSNNELKVVFRPPFLLND